MNARACLGVASVFAACQLTAAASDERVCIRQLMGREFAPDVHGSSSLKVSGFRPGGAQSCSRGHQPTDVGSLARVESPNGATSPLRGLAGDRGRDRVPGVDTPGYTTSPLRGHDLSVRFNGDQTAARSGERRPAVSASIAPSAGVPQAAPGPQPGDVYREFAIHNGGHGDWRVTDPAATAAGARRHLPNPVLQLHVGDLEHAIRAEALLDRWGGHLRTTAKRIRFNRNEWIPVPEIDTVPDGRRAERYYSQDNPIVEIPLGDLKEGANTIEATCGALENYGWGQWGLYSVIVRVYYDPQAKAHATGRIVEPADGESIPEHPTVRIEPHPGHDVARVDVLAWYDGYDENGDGHFQDWHAAWFQPFRGAPADLREHAGTLWRAPYELAWDTRWIPDQPPRSVKLTARIQSGDGVWYAAEPVENLSLERHGTSVRLYRAVDVPEGFGARAGREKSCTLTIAHDNLDHAVEAVLAIRTWHGWDGHHHPLMLNGRSFRIGGKNHHYDYDLLPVAVDTLKSGENVFTVRSDTEHHMLEVLWPGPALIVHFRE